jgi:hypothetical protein
MTKVSNGCQIINPDIPVHARPVHCVTYSTGVREEGELHSQGNVLLYKVTFDYKSNKENVSNCCNTRDSDAYQLTS